ncbi:hypothetical protein CDAR_561581 [Caerostris darwini]|uniref:Uncharacterized protein n=1 Tax=Caerostris darwini TaxID=1538125 RepID=A0AAV4MN21_9ARAC|nr:hypothetical protein CDAR_561581 [Caerostris darwini]
MKAVNDLKEGLTGNPSLSERPSPSSAGQAEKQSQLSKCVHFLARALRRREKGRQPRGRGLVSTCLLLFQTRRVAFGKGGMPSKGWAVDLGIQVCLIDSESEGIERLEEIATVSD